MTHQLNVNANTFVPATQPILPTPTRGPPPVTPPKQIIPHTVHARAWRRERDHQKLIESLRNKQLEKVNENVPKPPSIASVSSTIVPKKKNRHANHSRAWRREQVQKKQLESSLNENVNEAVLPQASPRGSTSSTTASLPPRLDPKIPLSSYWNLPEGLHPRVWTSVSGIGSGVEWGTAKVRGYGGIMYSDPRPMTEEEGEVDYVVEKGYGDGRIYGVM